MNQELEPDLLVVLADIKNLLTRILETLTAPPQVRVKLQDGRLFLPLEEKTEKSPTEA